MPAGANQKREREYEKLKTKFKKSGRYKGRAEEVASRIVNKQRARFGETKRAKAQEGRGQSPDRELPIKNFRHLTIDEITPKLYDLSTGEIRKLKSFEQKHKNRKTLIDKLNQQLH